MLRYDCKRPGLIRDVNIQAYRQRSRNNNAAVILVCLNTIVMQMRFVAIQTLLNFGMMKVNSGHHSGHPNRNIRYYDSEGNDDDIGEGGEPILGELSYPNKSSAVLRVKSVQCSA